MTSWRLSRPRRTTPTAQAGAATAGDVAGFTATLETVGPLAQARVDAAASLGAAACAYD